MSSSLGTIFKITTFGESHGPGIGVVIEGCPAGIALDTEAIQRELTRRKPGQSRLTTQRRESDDFEILSGVYEGRTLGTPIALLVRNKDNKPGDYLRWADVYRPSHADYTYDAKYGFRTPLGGGRASARETIGRVAAGAIAAQILREDLGMETIAWVDSVEDIAANLLDSPPSDVEQVDRSIVRCPDERVSDLMIERIDQARLDGDSLGGTVGVVVKNAPPGLGDPVFDKLEASLAQACLSIPACKGFENGSGFRGTTMRGSAHNDEFFPLDNDDAAGAQGGAGAENAGKSSTIRGVGDVPRAATRGNYSGGIQGGISNGMPILLRLAFKPTATIAREQNTINESGDAVTLKTGGRHDPCVLPRAVPIVEAMVNLTLVDAYLLQRALQPEWFSRYSTSRRRNADS